MLHDRERMGKRGSAEGYMLDCFCRKAGWDRVEGSRIVCNSPCYLLNLTIMSSGTAAGTATVYDGNSAVV
ncbi:unnamed protein product, partial [marine sediment metagenome]